jgi:uncharacterized protein YukE
VDEARSHEPRCFLDDLRSHARPRSNLWQGAAQDAYGIRRRQKQVEIP